MMSGVVDPETLYTKQNCIGTGPRLSFELPQYADRKQAEVVLEKFTKGRVSLAYFQENLRSQLTVT